MAATTFEVDGREYTFAQVSPETPFMLAMNKTTTIRAQGAQLGAAAHRIGMGFEVPGLGTLTFDFTDTPDGDG